MAKRNKGRNMKGDKQTLTRADVGKIPAEVVQATKTAEPTPPATTPASPQPVQAAPRNYPGKIKLLRNDVQYKGNRQAWYARLKEFDGKTLDEFLADAKERPPAMTRNNTPEPPMGWWSFFKREQVATVVTA